MAAVLSINEAPAVTTDDNWSMWRLANHLLTAGWQFVGSSNGTTMSLVSSNWGTYVGSADQANAWISLALPGNTTQGFTFWRRNTASIGDAVITPSRSITYTTTGWNTAGASASTPPVAIGTTHYIRGNSTTGGMNWFGSRASSSAINVTKVNFIIRDPLGDDPSFSVFGFCSGPDFPHYFGFHKITIPATDTSVTTIGDPYAIFRGDAASGWNNATPDPFSGVAGKAYYAVDYAGALVAHECYTLNSLALANADVKNRYISASAVYTEPMFLSCATGHKGFVNELRVHNTASSNGDFFDGGNWVKISSSSRQLVFPWNGTTTAIQFS